MQNVRHVLLAARAGEQVFLDAPLVLPGEPAESVTGKYFG